MSLHEVCMLKGYKSISVQRAGHLARVSVSALGLWCRSPILSISLHSLLLITI